RVAAIKKCALVSVHARNKTPRITTCSAKSYSHFFIFRSALYLLHKAKPAKGFVIAGDPFQIEPIVQCEQWVDENIYTLIGLSKEDAFSNPKTVPHKYKVTNLATQYRSVPAIGEVFSKFAYGEKLTHFRDAASRRPLTLAGLSVNPLKPLNIVKFPVSHYESIYRPKKLGGGSNYQPYSALLTFEFVKFITMQIEELNGGGDVNGWRIGIIAPYRAQASLIDKLVGAWRGKPACVEIQTGTIHGFQGDECDIVLAVFNPPPKISDNPRMFLNKRNILNVAISRARDYLFIFMPEDSTDDIENLKRIKCIELLFSETNECSTFAANTTESILFGNANYLEENTFATTHQSANVYGRPEKRYEVRSDENAVDVQILDDSTG
ncbi:MAG: hypothetical protein LBR07_04730, partial [Puniceicoccales bacterium]|nr:hypothetical protein [Puniceicoccales bacterium]